MERKVINPWTWQDDFGYSQGLEVTGSTQTLVCAGQTAMSADGQPMHPGDMPGQVSLALDNLETVLRQAGYDWSHVVRLNYYTTDVDALLAAFGQLGERMGAVGSPPGTLLGVARLAFPELLVEIEATAMK